MITQPVYNLMMKKKKRSIWNKSLNHLLFFFFFEKSMYTAFNISISIYKTFIYLTILLEFLVPFHAKKKLIDFDKLPLKFKHWPSALFQMSFFNSFLNILELIISYIKFFFVFFCFGFNQFITNNFSSCHATTKCFYLNFFLLLIILKMV